ANANGSAKTVCLKRTSPSRAGTSASPAAGDDARVEATRAILPPARRVRPASPAAVCRAARPLLAALALLLAPASAAVAKVVGPPANPDVLPRVVGQGAGRFLDADIDGGVVSWVADPGPGLPRSIVTSNGTAASVA